MSSFSVLSPIDQKLVGEFNFSSKSELEELRNLSLGPISKLKKREIFNRLISLLQENREKMAKAITLEMGKPIVEARVEVDRTINTAICCRDFLGNIEGEVISADAYMESPRRAIVERVALGKVLAIIPFNFPINLCIHKLGPSFIGGNVTIVKPNPQNYFSTKLFIELCYEAGFPKESLAFVCPDIEDLRSLISSDFIDCISFTGGTATADSISQIAGRKKLLFELGGNDPLIVNKDADLERAVDTLIAQRVGTCGQRCTAAKRSFIHDDVYDAFKTKLLEKLSSIHAMNPYEETCILGPLVTKESAQRVYDQCLEYSKLASVNFEKLEEPKNAFFEVAIAECSSLEDEAFSEEIFGPVISLFKFNDSNTELLIKKINSTGYGLQSGVFTRDLHFAQKIYDNLKVGSVNINEGSGFRAENFPFGGVSKSGQGREGVKYTFHELTTMKTLII